MAEPPRRKRKFGVDTTEPSVVKPSTTKSSLILPPQEIVVPRAPSIIVPRRTRESLVERFKNLLPDIEGIADKIIDSDLDHTQAIEVESKADDLVDWAPNVIAWCADKRFLGMRPFAKQAEALLHLYEEYCPRCSDKAYLKDIPVGDTVEQVMAKVALLDFGTCTHCGYTKARGREKGRFKDPTELIVVLGQRSGKTALTAMGISYLIHRNAKLTSPWKTYGLTPGQIVDFTIVATTVAQSEKTLWGTLKGIVENAHWFKQYRQVCNEEGKRHGVKETVKLAETFFWFGHKSMIIYFAANNPSSLRGTTRIGGGIDELGWFDAEEGSQKVRSNGPETYAALSNACFTLRGTVDEEIQKNLACTWPMPLMFCVSSPRAMNDAIMTLYREQAGNPRVVRRHWSTWEAHPKNTYKMLERLGETRKPTFARDFGAQPPLTDEPLIPRVHIITDAFKSPLAVDKTYGPVIMPSATGVVNELSVPHGTTTSTYLTAGLDSKHSFPDYTATKQFLTPQHYEAIGPLRKLLEELLDRPARLRPHIMGVDLGTTNNALAIVCGYLAGGGSKFVTDFVLEVKPTRNNPVNVADVYEHVIIPLVERLNVVAVFYDRWSSLHQIHDLAIRYGAKGPLNTNREHRAWRKELEHAKRLPPFLADNYSLNLADALLLVSRLEQGDCLFPAMETSLMELLVNKRLNPTNYPFAHLALQLATVRAKGNRLLKPVGGDDDIFRAWANAAVKALTDQLVVEMLKQEGRAQIMKKGVVNAYVSVGMAGKGLRRAENLRSGTVSTSGDARSPVVVRRGTFRG